MSTAFGNQTLRRSSLKTWLLDRLFMLEDPAGQITWAELFVCYTENVPVCLIDNLIVEPQNQEAADKVYNLYLTRENYKGRLRPAIACYYLAMNLAEEAVEQFALQYKCPLAQARGLLMVLVLSGEVEIRREKGSSYYVEQPHMHIYDDVRTWRQRYKNVKGRANIGGKPSTAP